MTYHPTEYWSLENPNPNPNPEVCALTTIVNNSWGAVQAYYTEKFHPTYTPQTYDDSLSLLCRFLPEPYIYTVIEHLFGRIGFDLLEENPDHFSEEEIYEQLKVPNNKYEEYFNTFFTQLNKPEYYKCHIIGPTVFFTLMGIYPLYEELQKKDMPLTDEFQKKARCFLMYKRYHEIKRLLINEVLSSSSEESQE